MADCGCTHDAPCPCEGCREKDALIGNLYHRIDELETATGMEAPPQVTRATSEVFRSRKRTCG